MFLAAGAPLLSAAEAPQWSVQYLIDNSRTMFGRAQKVSPRENRGLALSPNGRSLYAGYVHSFNNSGEVRRIAVDIADYDRATLAILPGVSGKAIATDDTGRVYLGGPGGITVYHADLARRQLSIPAGPCEGVATAREGTRLILYATDREAGKVRRWTLTEQSDSVASAVAEGLSHSGEAAVVGALDLRGIDVDAKGDVWVADLKGNRVYKMNREGVVVGSATVATPIDVACEPGRTFVTQYMERTITVLGERMDVLDTLRVPWRELELSPTGNSEYGALSGITLVAGGFMVANETGQTADQKSTYGREDDFTDLIGGKVYRDSFGDDDEPILRVTWPPRAP